MSTRAAEGGTPIAETPRIAAGRTEAAVALGATLLYVAVAVWGLLHHELWLDEAQAWVLARDSSSLGMLFAHMRYENNPGLWHVCLFALTRFSHDVLAMQLFHAALGAGATWLFVRHAPMPLGWRLLFPLGYYPLFEYGLISRSYMLTMGLAFAWVALHQRRPGALLLQAGVLALMGLTSMYGFLMALAFGAWTAWERRVDALAPRLVAGALLAGGLALAAVRMLPVPDLTFATAAVTSFDHQELVRAGAGLWLSGVPLPNLEQPAFWNSHFLLNGPRDYDVLYALAVGWMALSTALFVRRPSVAALYAGATALLLAFAYVKYPGVLRHQGHFFIVWLVCLWLSRLMPPASAPVWAGRACLGLALAAWAAALAPIQLVAGAIALAAALVVAGVAPLPAVDQLFAALSAHLRAHGARWVTAVFVAQALAGVYAYGQDLQGPFSPAKEAAAYVRAQGFAERLMVADQHGQYVNFGGPVLSAYLERPVWYLGNPGLYPGSYLLWNQDRLPLVPSETVLARLAAVVPADETGMIYSDFPIEAERADLRLTLERRFEGRLNGEDAAGYLYRVHKAKAGP